MVSYRLHNPNGLDTRTIERIVQACEIPSGSLFLYLGDSSIEPHYQGLTIVKAHIRSLGNIYGLEDYTTESWDCGIIISRTWCIAQSQYPAYFAFLVGHELGHAATAIADQELAAYEHLITVSQQHLAVPTAYVDLPHEILYDRVGVAVAERLYGRAVVLTQFAAVIDNGELPRHVARVQRAIGLVPTLSVSGLRASVAAFALPNRAELLRLWSEKKSTSAPGHTRYVQDLTSLWRLS